jgi:hypothetical protein
LHFGVRFGGQEAVQEPGGNEKLQPVFGAQLDPEPFPETGRSAPRIDRDVPDAATRAAHQLGLRHRRRLIVQPAQHAGRARQRVVVLTPADIETALEPWLAAPGLGEKPACIHMPFRAHQQEAGDGRGFKDHQAVGPPRITASALTLGYPNAVLFSLTAHIRQCRSLGER